MATHDVPGFGTAINDELKMGVWGEHEDGSLIFVESTEGNRVIYSMFDTAKDPIIEYRDAMPEDGFKKTFSWTHDGKKTDKDKWSWHNRTLFPWDKVIKQGFSDGPRIASAGALKTAAERVAESLRLRGAAVSKHLNTRTDQVRSKTGHIMSRINNALAALKKDPNQ